LAEFDEGPLKGGLLFFGIRTGLASPRSISEFFRIWHAEHKTEIDDSERSLRTDTALQRRRWCKNRLPRTRLEEIPSQFILSDRAARQTLFSLGGCDSLLRSDPQQTKVRFSKTFKIINTGSRLAA
jgi:hypothetical protein